MKPEPVKVKKRNIKIPKSLEELPARIQEVLRKVSVELDTDVYLHGSWAKGTQHKDSDIDIAICGNFDRFGVIQRVRRINSNLDVWVYPEDHKLSLLGRTTKMLCYRRQ